MKHNYKSIANSKLFIIILVFVLVSSAYAQAPPNDSVADAIQVTDINYTDPGVNIDQAAQILQGSDCTIPDGTPEAPFSAVVYKFSIVSAGDVTVTIDSPSGTSTVNIYTATDLNATTGSDLTLVSSCGTRTSLTNACSAGQTYYVSVVNTGGASDISFSGDAALPVELVSFSYEKINGYVKLVWETATETNNYGFEIERKLSNQKAEWESIGFVEGSGNSNSPKSYEFVDENPPSSIINYRLKQLDISGEHEYYGPVVELDNSITSITEDTPLPDKFSLSQNYPNPFNPSTTIKYGLPEVSNVKMEVFNSLGQRITLLVNSEKQPGYHFVNWNAKTLPSGVYLIRLIVEGKTSNQNFVKVSKALLLK